MRCVIHQTGGVSRRWEAGDCAPILIGRHSMHVHDTRADASAGDFVEFVRLVDSLHLVSAAPIFRGQPTAGNLLPGIARRDPTQDTTRLEREMLRQFTLVGAHLLPPAATVLDQLVIAQHHEMKTRLLDWTSNPLAAAWFACSSSQTGDVYVYAFDTQDALLEDPYTFDPFKHGETKVFQPRQNNARIVAQQGWFTLHTFSKKWKRWVALDKNEKLKGRLILIEIPEESRGEMLKSISKHGTSMRTLFPDLVGICHDLNWRHDVA